MTSEPMDWRSPAVEDLLEAIAALPDRAAAGVFLRDLCTLRELHDMAQRWHVVQLLDQGRHYAEIARETGASTATITRIAQWLNHGTGGYREALARGAGVAARTASRSDERAARRPPWAPRCPRSAIRPAAPGRPQQGPHAGADRRAAA